MIIILSEKRNEKLVFDWAEEMTAQHAQDFCDVCNVVFEDNYTVPYILERFSVLQDFMNGLLPVNQVFIWLVPIGLILCSEGNTEHIEYLMLDEDSPIKVAQYYTKLPDKKLLSEKLQRAIAIAKEHYAEQMMDNRDDGNT